MAGAVPMVAALVSPAEAVAVVVTVTTLLALAVLGALGAWAGRPKLLRPTLRVVFWGGAAMAVTAAIRAIWGRGLGRQGCYPPFLGIGKVF